MIGTGSSMIQRSKMLQCNECGGGAGLYTANILVLLLIVSRSIHAFSVCCFSKKARGKVCIQVKLQVDDQHRRRQVLGGVHFRARAGRRWARQESARREGAGAEGKEVGQTRPNAKDAEKQDKYKRQQP